MSSVSLQACDDPIFQFTSEKTTTHPLAFIPTCGHVTRQLTHSQASNMSMAMALVPYPITTHSRFVESIVNIGASLFISPSKWTSLGTCSRGMRTTDKSPSPLYSFLLELFHHLCHPVLFHAPPDLSRSAQIHSESTQIHSESNQICSDLLRICSESDQFQVD